MITTTDHLAQASQALKALGILIERRYQASKPAVDHQTAALWRIRRLVERADDAAQAAAEQLTYERIECQRLLDDARDRAVEAGVFHYSPGAMGQGRGGDALLDAYGEPKLTATQRADIAAGVARAFPPRGAGNQAQAAQDEPATPPEGPGPGDPLREALRSAWDRCRCDAVKTTSGSESQEGL